MIRDQGIDLQYLDGPELERRFPGLHGADVGFDTFTPQDGYVDPPGLVWALAGVAGDAGVTIREGAAAQRVEVADGRVGGVAVGGELLEAPHVLVAAGAWSRVVLRASGLDIPLKAYRLEVLFALARQPGPWPVVLDRVRDTYFVPRNPDSGRGQPPHRGADRGAAAAARPGAGGRPLPQAPPPLPRCRPGSGQPGLAGFTDATPHRRPLIGQYCGVDGLQVACGLAGYGVMRGPRCVGRRPACCWERSRAWTCRPTGRTATRASSTSPNLRRVQPVQARV